jgi:hypothetical protein
MSFPVLKRHDVIYKGAKGLFKPLKKMCNLPWDSVLEGRINTGKAAVLLTLQEHIDGNSDFTTADVNEAMTMKICAKIAEAMGILSVIASPQDDIQEDARQAAVFCYVGSILAEKKYKLLDVKGQIKAVFLPVLDYCRLQRNCRYEHSVFMPPKNETPDHYLKQLVEDKMLTVVDDTSAAQKGTGNWITKITVRILKDGQRYSYSGITQSICSNKKASRTDAIQCLFNTLQSEGVLKH